MRKIILPVIILLLLFGAVSFAQEAELPEPGLTPDSVFYFLDTFWEKISMFFTFDAEKKAKRALKIAEEKLAEVKVMAEKNKVKALEEASRNYQQFLGLANKKAKQAEQKGRDVEQLTTLITEKTLKYQEVLLEVHEKVPNPAQPAIEKAMEVSKKGFEKAIQGVSEKKKKELQKEFQEITTEILVYPGASELEVPLKIKKELQEEGSEQMEVKIYSSDDSIQEIKDWYETQLEEKGWKEKIKTKEMMLWEKGKVGLSMIVTREEEALRDLKLEEEKSVILLAKDKIEVWEKMMEIPEKPVPSKPVPKKKAPSTRKEYCEKRTCQEISPQWAKQECQVEKCTCKDCKTASKCWNAWTEKDCQQGETCKDLYGTDYRESSKNYVYKVEPTRNSKNLCPVNYHGAGDGTFTVTVPEFWKDKYSKADQGWIYLYKYKDFAEIISKEEGLSLPDYKKRIETSSGEKLLESKIVENRYTAYLEQNSKTRSWASRPEPVSSLAGSGLEALG